MVNEFKVGVNLPENSALAFGPAGLRPARRLAVGFVHLVVDRRARHDRHRPQRPADPRHQRGVDHRFVVRSAVDLVRGCGDDDARRPHLQGRVRVSHASTSKFQFLGSNELSYNGINDFIDNRPNQYAVTADSPFFKPQQFYAIGFAAGLVASRATG